MAITDPTIDPITGLPVFDSSGIIQQIPLGRQTTDFASWNATAQPTRGPLFPDDGFPVFTNTQGQHPTTGNAQSIESDGAHALKVYQVNPSQGGGGVSPIEGYSYSNVQDSVGNSFDINLGTLDNFRLVYLNWAWAAVPSSIANPAFLWLSLLLEIDSLGNDWNLLYDYCTQTGASTDRMSNVQNVVFPNPIDFGSVAGAGSHSYKARFLSAGPGTQSFHVSCNFGLY